MSKNLQNLKIPKGQNLSNNATHKDENPSKKWQNSQKWYDKNECAGRFWLKVTLVLVSVFYHPFLRPILKLCIAFVTSVYFIFSPNERRNIARFYENLEDFITSQNPQTRLKPKSWLQRQWQIYGNFYEFGSAICDKIASWLGKISHKDIEIINMDFIKNELMPTNNNAESKKGQILVVSHFGNIEVCRALRNEMGEMGKIPLSILMYEKIAKDFIALLRHISKDKECHNNSQNPTTNSLPKSYQSIILVDNLDMDSLLQIKDLLDNGVNIGIMGDRVAIQDGFISRGKNAKFHFLGKPCYFPQGAFFLAGLLNVKISMLWCEKINGKYQIELENISKEPVKFMRDKSSLSKESQVRELAQKYVTSLQKRAVANPKSWFNFYDFFAS